MPIDSERTIPSVGERETSWTLIDAARDGDRAARERFATEYESIVRAYFSARWSRGRLASEIDDAVQEVWIDCLRDRGALERADPERPFRPFLSGVARTVALRFEQRRGRDEAAPVRDESHEARETRLSVAFDRAFAQQVMREASELQRTQAAAAGGVKVRRVELLELRFQRGLTIPQIAEQWGEDAARLHHLYADARDDFRDALREVVKRRNGGGDAALERECDWMLEVLRASKG
jgi:RNA polymerase sigma factor (sigma-70 family)